MSTNPPLERANAPVIPPPPPPAQLIMSPLVFRDAVFPDLEPYSGEPGLYRSFLLKCSLAFAHSPRSFSTDSVRLAYLVAKLQGKTLLWAEAYMSIRPLPICSYDEYLGEFKNTFAHSMTEGEMEDRWLGLQQGDRSIAEFIIDFRTSAAEAN